MDNVFTHLQEIGLTILGLAILATAVGVGMSSRKANYAQTAKTSFNVVAALVIAAIGVGVVGLAFAKQILKSLGVI